MYNHLRMIAAAALAALAVMLLALAQPALSQQTAPPEGVPIQFSGRIEAINPGTLVANRQAVDITNVPLTTPLQIGMSVAIRGYLLPDGRIQATSVTPGAGGLVTATPRPPVVPTPLPPPTTIPLATPVIIPTAQPPVPGPVAARPYCPQTQAFWRVVPGEWPVTSLTLGARTYSRDELLRILETPVEADPSVRLAHQLIAAKLNLALGAPAEPVASAITQADALLAGVGAVLPLRVSSGDTTAQAMIATATLLEQYNHNRFATSCTPLGREGYSGPVADSLIGRSFVLEGPLNAVEGNLLRVYGFTILVEDERQLRGIELGDVVRIEGTFRSTPAGIVVLTSKLERLDDDDSLTVWFGDNCQNPPPDHAVARGWRARCEQGQHPGRGNDRGSDNASGRGNDRGSDNASGRGNDRGSRGNGRGNDNGS